MKKVKLLSLIAAAVSLMMLSGCREDDHGPAYNMEGKALVITRALKAGDKHGFAIMDIDPESEGFGTIIHKVDVNTVEPPHHIYISPKGRIYSTCLDPQNSLMEIKIAYEAHTGVPSISSVDKINTGGQQTGEDIAFATIGGKEVFYVTFMGGDGSANGGSVGKFDASTNELITTIAAPYNTNPTNTPYIRYPHGISISGNFMVVTETLHPSLSGGVGNSISLIDLITNHVVQTVPVGDEASAPVEVLFVRSEIVPGLTQPAVLINTMFGGDVWRCNFNTTTNRLGAPTRIINGGSNSMGVPLEFYANLAKDELFVSFGHPGVVTRYRVDKLPDLVPSGKNKLTADAGAHHMVFFKTKSGKDVVAVQNNLLNLGVAGDADDTDIPFGVDLSANTITIHDVATGERLNKIDIQKLFGKGVENIEGILHNKNGFHH